VAVPKVQPPVIVSAIDLSTRLPEPTPSIVAVPCIVSTPPVVMSMKLTAPPMLAPTRVMSEVVAMS